jgi:hypothetical protein
MNNLILRCERSEPRRMFKQEDLRPHARKKIAGAVKRRQSPRRNRTS